MKQYRPLIDSLSFQFSSNLPDEERDDLFQEATIAFFNALEQYDPERKIAFGYFAKVCISNRLIGYLRKRTTIPLPLENVELTAEEDPSKRLRDEEAYRALCGQLQIILSDFEYRVWMLYVAGRTAREIAKMVEKDQKSVENTLARARRKIRKSLPPR